MIIPATGEVSFLDALRITAHTLIERLLLEQPPGSVSTQPLPVQGWNRHLLGKHESEYGMFEVEVVTGNEQRVEGVFISHIHPFYEDDTPEDSERRAFHEGVIATEL